MFDLWKDNEVAIHLWLQMCENVIDQTSCTSYLFGYIDFGRAFMWGKVRLA